jgi:hypothetical protein
MGISSARTVLRALVKAARDAAISEDVAYSAAGLADRACFTYASRLVTTRRCWFETHAIVAGRQPAARSIGSNG